VPHPREHIVNLDHTWQFRSEPAAALVAQLADGKTSSGQSNKSRDCVHCRVTGGKLMPVPATRTGHLISAFV